jgi:uncharacterized protein (TIGR02301 family)
VDLAYVLGESNALRQTCVGKTDYYWFNRMKQVIDLEAPEQAFKVRLIQSFNSGYAAGQSGYPKCDDKSKAEAQKAAQRGRSLSDKLAAP